MHLPSTLLAKIHLHDEPRPIRVVLTGSRTADQASIADLLVRELGAPAVLVPNAANLVFSGGFPRSPERHALMAAQHTLFAVQHGLEVAQAALHPHALQLCVGGTVDGAAHWPGAPEEFFAEMGTTQAAQYARYDAVMFFAPVSTRDQPPSAEPAGPNVVPLHTRLLRVWQGHPRFGRVRHYHSVLSEALCAHEQLRLLVKAVHDERALVAGLAGSARGMARVLLGPLP